MQCLKFSAHKQNPWSRAPFNLTGGCDVFFTQMQLRSNSLRKAQKKKKRTELAKKNKHIFYFEFSNRYERWRKKKRLEFDVNSLIDLIEFSFQFFFCFQNATAFFFLRETNVKKVFSTHSR